MYLSLSNLWQSEIVRRYAAYAIMLRKRLSFASTFSTSPTFVIPLAGATDAAERAAATVERLANWGGRREIYFASSSALRQGSALGDVFETIGRHKLPEDVRLSVELDHGALGRQGVVDALRHAGVRDLYVRLPADCRDVEGELRVIAFLKHLQRQGLQVRGASVTAPKGVPLAQLAKRLGQRTVTKSIHTLRALARAPTGRPAQRTAFRIARQWRRLAGEPIWPESRILRELVRRPAATMLAVTVGVHTELLTLSDSLAT